ncbi:TetR/AcrR family transcriptional regulator [Rhodococcus sp. PAMC28707]|uniref:TetR/AcrR family transcriptional regulator n=1 Tax=unclassified Rhodococcus (in: high G+C Gram-positive bacteria) TaxID=192944 RepID=UPI00109E225E|nr:MULTISPECIES: TetR/AcrR family transcriptional regulator [unclassified Rhodococcus (in: high G+C Gram-positive bacteria)]QCB49263.1 TetR/AcrR family transcriptional regulator [Rhodococcus sp. PAMC28705]QCB59049.1 TetR/AcrR family transcriptional regulator [Rhodococcus sp. PAMC28707]
MNIDERRRHRYATLLDAGVALLGSPGGPAVSVRAVCRSASLTERYFYESFTDRDEYVRTVYAHVGRRARAAIETAVATSVEEDRAGAPVRAFVELVLDNPAVGRVLLLAPLSEPAISRSGTALVPTFVELVRAELTGIDVEDQHLVAIGVVGALTSLFVGYLDGTVTATREKFLAHCVRLVTDAGRTARQHSARVP